MRSCTARLPDCRRVFRAPACLHFGSIVCVVFRAQLAFTANKFLDWHHSGCDLQAGEAEVRVAEQWYSLIRVGNFGWLTSVGCACNDDLCSVLQLLLSFRFCRPRMRCSCLTWSPCLRYLRLGANSGLSGSLPTTFGFMTALTYAMACRVDASLDRTLSGRLHLLVGVPLTCCVVFVPFSAVRYLLLNSCAMSGELPSSMSMMTALQYAHA